MLETNIDRWEAQAIAKGVQQGMQRGEAFLLQRQLTRRFGELSATQQAKLAAATPAQLEIWGDRVLDARSLDEVSWIPAMAGWRWAGWWWKTW